jgi:hypothetical protein
LRCNSIEGNGRDYLGEDFGDEIPKICLQILRNFGGDLRGGVRGRPARIKTAKALFLEHRIEKVKEYKKT